MNLITKFWLVSLLIILGSWGDPRLAIAVTNNSVAPQKPQKAPQLGAKKVSNFQQLRSLVTDLIGRAESRIILMTDFISDGDISSALFLAKYRQVKTVVFLGPRKMNRYLSRVRYLKAQNIPVFVRPSYGSFKDPTLLLIDRRLYRISRDLDVLKSSLEADVQQAHPTWVPRFEAEIVRALKNTKQAIPKPLPMVGRPRHHPRTRQKVTRPYRGEGDGSYNYDRSTASGRSAPVGVPTKLPKATVFQKRQQKLERELDSQMQQEAASAEADNPRPQKDDDQEYESIREESPFFAPQPTIDRFKGDQQGSKPED